MRNLPSAVRTALATATLFAGFSTLHAAEASSDDIAALRDQIRQLDQKLKVLERKQEIAADDAAAAAKTAPKITVNDKGFSIASTDGANQLKLRGLVQADARAFLHNDPAITNNNTFLLRRARVIFEGTFNKNISFLLVPEFAGSAPTVVDAYVNYALTPSLQLRAGRFREPVGLEQLQSDAVAFFNERSYVSQLVPNRDLGVQLWGELLDGTLTYALGVFNGVPDGNNNGAISGTTVNADSDKDKDLAARIFAQPWKNDGGSPLQGLGFGLGASTGREKSGSGLASYKTDGQQTVFSYATATAATATTLAPATSKTNFTTVANGKTWRVSPQFYYYRGSFGLLGEYAFSSLHVSPQFPASLAGSPTVALKNKAWQLATSYVLTGEDAGYTGVVPATNFDWAGGSWGAFELVARYDVLDLDNKAFVTPGAGYSPLANNANNPTKLTTVGVGLNWYLSKSVRASFDFFHTDFGLNVPASAILSTSSTGRIIKNDENAFVTRLQVAF